MKKSLAILCVALAAPTGAMADSAAETHDGFFLRFSLLAGALRADAEPEDNRTPALKAEGGAGILNVQIGGTVASNFIVYGTLSATAASGPKLSVGDNSAELDEDVTFGWTGVGVGVSYYLDSNFYFGGGLRGSRIRLEFDQGNLRSQAQSETGGEVFGQFGYEWWVSDEWGIGLGLEAQGGKIKTDRGDWSFGAFGIGLSATYN